MAFYAMILAKHWSVFVLTHLQGKKQKQEGKKIGCFLWLASLFDKLIEKYNFHYLRDGQLTYTYMEQYSGSLILDKHKRLWNVITFFCFS